MAAFNRPTEATYEIHENVKVDTLDNEDHTFCGIMFPIKCKDLLPLDHLVIKSIAVRGYLGPLTVWVSKEIIEEGRQHQHQTSDQLELRRNTSHKFKLKAKHWDKLYEKTHSPSVRTYCSLELDKPIVLKPGQVRAIYIHSTLPGDQAIVYDNSHYHGSKKRYQDDKLVIHSGRAHVSTEVFGRRPIWGWGNAWRERREFVGKLEYGAVYKLWNPHMHLKFGGNFQEGARALMMCQRRWESPWSRLPDECIYYILNMCRWDWFEDNSKGMKLRRKKEKSKLKAILQQKQEEDKKEKAAAAEAAVQQEEKEDDGDKKVSAKPAGVAGMITAAVHAAGTVAAVATAKPAMSAMSGMPHRTPCSKKRSADDMIVADNQKPSSQSSDDDDDDGQGGEDSDDDIDDECFESADERFFIDVEQGEEEDHEDQVIVAANADDSSSDDDDWSADDGYHRANIRAFDFDDVDSDVSDDEQDDEGPQSARSQRQDWLRRQFARIHVLRALGNMDDDDVRVVFQHLDDNDEYGEDDDDEDEDEGY